MDMNDRFRDFISRRKFLRLGLGSAAGLAGTGVLGGAVMIIFDLGMSPTQFLTRLQGALSYNHFLVGIVKAPVFAVIIALVGCEKGLVTKRNAESVGLQTTLSVVQSIFLVIVVDAIFSIFFAEIGV